MALVSGIITINSKNEFSTFKRMQVSDITDLLSYLSSYSMRLVLTNRLRVPVFTFRIPKT